MAPGLVRRIVTAAAGLLLAATTVSTAPAGATAAPAAPHQHHTVSYDKYSLSIDGKRTSIWAGEFHYWRLPSPDEWRDVLQKMKAGGYNAATIYFDWGYHSPAPGKYDFTGVRDVDKLLDIASEVGIYVIARQGPYINAETDGGGFPGWLNRMKVRERSTDPTYLKYADQWLSAIDPIIARHQLTNGTGTVILDQVENEFYDGSAEGNAYFRHLEDKYRADGITVPLTGNNNGTFNSGTGELDIDGWDSYPEGFNCSNPTHWSQVPDYSAQRDSLTDRPLYLPEYQGGAFDPWGGAGYDKCRQLTNADFEKVFYDTNIAAGATLQSFYMTYGGTSWGYLPFPGVYTSYDYGSAIAEDRELTDKYSQQKLTGYLLAAAPSLAKTDTLPGVAQSNPALWLKGRVNPDDGTQLYVLRHGDATSTATDRTHLTVDLTGRTGFSHDDNDAALHYTGDGWTHATGQGGDYDGTESWSDHAGDAMSVSFTGTSVRWIAPKDANHGITEVSIDGTKVADVDGYAPSKQYQVALYRVDDLSDGPHTLTLTTTGDKNPKATGTFTTVDAVDVPPPAGANYYPSVPQQPGTSIAVDGRDAKLLLADYAFGDQKLVYSTSQLMTQATIGGTDTALLYEPKGDDGETVLRYGAEPDVRVLSGDVTAHWDADRGDLRLDYTHDGLAEVRITGGGRRPLDLLLADTATAKQFWRDDTSAGPVLVRGPELVRTAAASHGALALTGDTDAKTPLAVWAPPSLRRVSWNGTPVHSGGTLAGPAPVTLPTLSWRTAAGTPEAATGYDDSGWTIADHTGTDNPNGTSGVPVLYADDYGFHAGDVWYRGHFTATGKETSIALAANTGNSTGQYSAWLNGRYLGTANGTHTFDLPADALKPGADNVVSVLVANMGHDEGTGMAVRGLTSARLAGSAAALTWRIQGDRGGENLIDPARGPLNTGGLAGERAGLTLPGYPDGTWSSATLPASSSTPGITWYRSEFSLHVPHDQDVPIALRFADDASRSYRVQIYLNGWNLGLYVNDVGPQHDFQLPPGLLDPSGRNTLALAVWSADTHSGLGHVSLAAQANLRGGVPVSTVPAPRYDPHRYAQPAAPGGVTLDAPDTMAAGHEATAAATVSVPRGRPAVRHATVTLSAPDGWQVTGDRTVSLGAIRPGETKQASWSVTAPAAGGDRPWGGVLTAAADLDGTTVRGAQTVSVPPPAPTGTAYVSDLPFTATNGWGPVERDTSNGEQAAGDGRPITLGGTSYAKGIGTNAVSDLTVYTGGQCTAFTATVGVDAETGGGGSVTFSVTADGATRKTTAVLTASSTPVTLNVDVTGADYVDLIVGDGGDGNGLDHADWADAQLHCT